MTEQKFIFKYVISTSSMCIPIISRTVIKLTFLYHLLFLGARGKAKNNTFDSLALSGVMRDTVVA